MMECVKYIRMLKKRNVDEARKLQGMLREKYAEHDQIHDYSGSCDYVTHAIVHLLKTTFGVRDGPPQQRGPNGGRRGGESGESGAGANKNKKTKKKKKKKGRA